MAEWQTWTIKDFSEGLIDRVEDNLLPENVTVDCLNMYSKKLGSLQKRPGQLHLNNPLLSGAVRGLHAYYKDTSRYLVAAAGGKVWYWNPGTSAFVDIKTGLDSSALTSFETCVNYMVVFNGVNNPWKWDGTTVSNLANAPADGQFALLHKEKLFTVPMSEPSRLKWSDSFQPESWPAVNYWDIKPGDGDKITCLQKHMGTLVIFKRRSIHVLYGSSLDDFRCEEMNSKIGCVGKFAAYMHDPYVFFVSDEGLCVWNGQSVQNLSAGRIPGFWNRVNKNYISKTAIAAWDNLIWVALPIDSSTYNNVILIYQLPEQGATNGKFWLWTNIFASCFQIYNDGTQDIYYNGNPLIGYVNKQYTGNTDFDSAIPCYWIGKSFAIDTSERRCFLGWAYVQDVPGADDVDLQFSVDYGSFFSLSPDNSDSDTLLRRFNFFDTFKGRYLRPKIVHSGATSCEVKGIKVYYKPIGVIS